MTPTWTPDPELHRRMWRTVAEGVKLSCQAGPDDGENRATMLRFVHRLGAQHPDVLGSLLGVEFIHDIPWLSLRFLCVPSRYADLWEEQIERALVVLPWPEFGRFAAPNQPLRVQIDCPGVQTVWSLEDDDIELIEAELNGQWRRRR
jgi:hypothetical protein